MRREIGNLLLACAVLTVFTGCSPRNEVEKPEAVRAEAPAPVIEKDANVSSPEIVMAVPEEPSLINPAGESLQARIKTPAGFKRIDAKEQSFASFLRNYPMKPDESPVLLYDGTNKRNQNAHEAVFAMHLEPEDFQQCADSVMRIYAEYLYQKQAYGQISFHLVSGFVFDFDTWRQGNKLKVSGDSAYWTESAANDSSEASFEQYLHILFAYASTLSMSEESEAIDIANLQIGDIFIKGGSPGHVVMVADVCVNEQGEKAFLLAQGYMPAQEFHILKNPLHPNDPWYYASEQQYPFKTPEYTFSEGSLKHPPYLAGETPQ